jgi:hypothetical protein
MSETAYRERFARIFTMNVERRSRTAKGDDEGAKTSSTKLPLLLKGEALKAKVAENTVSLIDAVFAAAARIRGRGTDIWSADLRDACENWFDISTVGLIDREGYEPLFRELQVKSAKLGQHLRINRRYRLWTPKYLALQIPPALIDEQLSAVYARLALSLSALPALSDPSTKSSVLPIMSYADVMMDGEVHPWCDACSRVATAVVMWIAAFMQTTPPLFGPREEHYASIQDLQAHERYLAACVERADAEAP